jgi:hypothetical protein
MKNQNYKMRAEGLCDLINAIAGIKPSKYTISGCGWPCDAEMEFESELCIVEILNILYAIQDGHVMAETVEEEASYDGERRTPEERVERNPDLRKDFFGE